LQQLNIISKPIITEMHKNITSLFLILVLSSIIFISGCGKKDETSSGENTGETKVEEQKSDQTTTQNEQKSSNELGIKEGLPADYPSDVPQPKNSKVLGSLNTSEGTVVTFESTDKPKDIYNQYAEDLKKSGYKESDDNQMSDEGGMAMWNKDKKEVNIMLAWDKDKSKSSVVVTYK
jgi:major membrane immunogen (membrane-anchored lipoprotein)